MSYAVFLLLFLVIPITGLLAARRGPLAGRGDARARWSIGLVCLIAFTYTTPWDNYLVASGIWGYGPDRVLATIGWVPVEEYAFFLLQPILTGLLLYRLVERLPARAHGNAVVVVRTLSLVALVAAGIGVACLGAGGRWTYLGLILAWACPVLAALLFAAAPLLARHAVAAGGAFLASTLYLCSADRWAIHDAIWHIEEATSTGWFVLGLPFEEGLFFAVTNALVVAGLVLFLEGDRLRNFSTLQAQGAQG